ncbi:MAG: hypothetical protein M3067_14740 [Chloroflexota bacterium]|nr:hypothetical protein [Chloroflexota bacterium]
MGLQVAVLPMILSFSGVLVAGIAFYNRGKPEWQRDMPRIMILAVGQVVLGVVAWLVLSPP